MSSKKRGRRAFLPGSIIDLFKLGKEPLQIASQLGCAFSTVYRVLKHESYDSGYKSQVPGRKVLFGERMQQIVLRCRAENPTSSGRMLRFFLSVDRQLYGLEPDEKIPSANWIDKLIAKQGLAHKPVGPRSGRCFPLNLYPDLPGTLSIDGFGPFDFQGFKLYLVTIIDQKTRLFCAFPSTYYGDMPGCELPRYNQQVWLQALVHFQQKFLDRPIECVRSDNQTGLEPNINGCLPPATRWILGLGAKLQLIPPSQPWFNGKIERPHRTMHEEFWRKQGDDSHQVLENLPIWLNKYNFGRPHRACDYNAPALHCGFGEKLQSEFWQGVQFPEVPGVVNGVLEAVRLVDGFGNVPLWWGQQIQIPFVPGGQYVRLQFHINGGDIGQGFIYWHSRPETPQLVGKFTHRLDVPKLGNQAPFAWDIEQIGQMPLFPANQNLDQAQYDAQRQKMSRPSSRKKSKIEPLPDVQDHYARMQDQKFQDLLDDRKAEKRAWLDALKGE